MKQLPKRFTKVLALSLGLAGAPLLSWADHGGGHFGGGARAGGFSHGGGAMAHPGGRFAGGHDWHGGGWGGGWRGDGWRGGGWGGWGWDPWWGLGIGLGLGAYYSDYYAPYYDPYYYPGTTVIQQPMAPVAPQGTTMVAPNGGGNWFWCESARGYYPYVKQCPEPWRAVPAVPPDLR